MRLRTVIYVASAVLLGAIATGFWYNAAEENTDARGWGVAHEYINDEDDTEIAVQIQPKFVKTRAIYDDAVKTLCFIQKHGKYCEITFWLPGGEIPPKSIIRIMGEFKPLADWQSARNEFMGWDCDRAGVEGSPPSALCGVGVEEAYTVAVSLGMRRGVGEFCNWPSRPDIPGNLSAVLSDMAKRGRADLMKSGYAETAEIGRDGKSGWNCQASRAELDNKVAEAVAAWRGIVSKPAPGALNGEARHVLFRAHATDVVCRRARVLTYTVTASRLVL